MRVRARERAPVRVANSRFLSGCAQPKQRSWHVRGIGAYYVTIQTVFPLFTGKKRANMAAPSGANTGNNQVLLLHQY